MDKGNRGSWPVMEYKLPESDWTVVIKYTYQHSEADRTKTKAFCDAMDEYKPIGFSQDDFEKEEENNAEEE